MQLNKLFVVLLASGLGKRMLQTSSSQQQLIAHSTKKQFLPLKKKPLFLHSLEQFLRLVYLDALLLVHEDCDAQKIMTCLKNAGVQSQKIHYVCGGTTRSKSVGNALLALQPKAAPHDFVLIHDAARPFVQLRDVCAVVHALYSYPCVSLGHPITDSVKQVDHSNIVVSQLDRKPLRAVQTPQGFHYAVLKKAYQDYSYTECSDDAQFVALANYKVCVIPASPLNIKVTFPSDFLLAEMLAESLL